MNFVLLPGVGAKWTIAALEVSELETRLEVVDDGLHGDRLSAFVAFGGLKVVMHEKMFEVNTEAVVLRFAD